MHSHAFTVTSLIALVFAAGCSHPMRAKGDAGGEDAKTAGAKVVGADAAISSDVHESPTLKPTGAETAGVDAALADLAVSADTKLVAKSISSSYRARTCAVLTDDTVRCWWLPIDVPVKVEGIANIASVSAGSWDNNCAVLSNGTIQCWGILAECSANGCPYTAIPVPTTVSGITNAVAVSAGGYHDCALLGNGNVQCWGYNHDGQLGDGTVVPYSAPTPTEFPLVTVPGIHNATAVSAGDEHTCALLIDGTVQCWGGVFGRSSSLEVNLVPTTISGIKDAIAIASSPRAACAVLRGGTVQCLGSLGGGIGDGKWHDSSVPVTLVGISNAIAVAPGYSHSCAVLADGSVVCWGNNANGELGNGTTTSSNVPAEVPGIVNAVAVTVGDRQSCVLLSSGSVQCWGYNGRRSSLEGDSLVPVTVVGF
jgi:alpha-tubulin suppressor-like RCC1 family protein